MVGRSKSLERGYPRIRAFLIAGMLAILCGCGSSKSESEQEMIQDSVRQLAPEGGTGVKRYYYESGELKEEAYWRNQEVSKIVYHGKSARILFVYMPHEKRALDISLNEDGEIAEIFQLANFAKDGYCFSLENGVIRKIQRFKPGGDVCELVVFGTESEGDGVRSE